MTAPRGPAAKAGLMLASLALAFALCEASLRTLTGELVVDIRRRHMGVWLDRAARLPCARHPGVAFLTPGAGLRRKSPNLDYSYRTRSVRLGECEHAYRLAGRPDAPVFGLILGDSHSECRSLSDEESWPGVLAEATGKTFANAAKQGWGTSGQREAARFFIPALHPRVVIMQITDNDLNDDILFDHFRGFDAGETPWRSALRGLQRRTVRGPLRSSTLANLCVIELNLALFPTGAAFEPVRRWTRLASVRQRQKQNIDAVRKMAGEAGARFGLVFFGDPAYLDEMGIRDYCERTDTPLHRPPWQGAFKLRADDRHDNVRGNKLIATGVRRALREWGWL